MFDGSFFSLFFSFSFRHQSVCICFVGLWLLPKVASFGAITCLLSPISFHFYMIEFNFVAKSVCVW